jgi:cob(I)alamin adenosyltransferase
VSDIIEDRGRGFLIEIGEELTRLHAENSALKAEVATLKANDPLAEMWAALAEYQEQADKDGHGESWRIMCEERTSCAADTARTVARRVARAATAGIGREATREVAAACAADTAFDASWDATRAAAWAANAIALIRQAKEAQP